MSEGGNNLRYDGPKTSLLPSFVAHGVVSLTVQCRRELFEALISSLELCCQTVDLVEACRFSRSMQEKMNDTAAYDIH